MWCGGMPLDNCTLPSGVGTVLGDGSADLLQFPVGRCTSESVDRELCLFPHKCHDVAIPPVLFFQVFLTCTEKSANTLVMRVTPSHSRHPLHQSQPQCQHIPNASRNEQPPRTSLIPDALQDLQTRPLPRTSKEEAHARRRALSIPKLPSFAESIHAAGLPPVTRSQPGTLQLNVGLYCNQACSHCHVESSPLRTQEMMDRATANRCLELLRGASDTVRTLDLTGGAPELNNQFRCGRMLCSV